MNNILKIIQSLIIVWILFFIIILIPAILCGLTYECKYNKKLFTIILLLLSLISFLFLSDQIYRIIYTIGFLLMILFVKAIK